VGVAVQGAAFVAGVALLIWCASLALRPENRAQLERLGEAPAWVIASLLGLTLLGLALDGLVFQILLRPVRRLPVGDVLATNALAVFLNYLPFKAGLIARVVVHTRRDGVPLLVVGAMLAAALAVLVCVALPLGLAGAWRGGIDAAWAGAVAAGMLVLGAACVAAARLFAGPAGKARLDRLGRRLPGWRRLSASRAFHSAHAGLAIAADPRVFAAAAIVRLCFFGTMWARFALAARVAGVEIGPEAAVVTGSVFFLIGVVSPGGLLGIREGGTTWLAGAVVLAGVRAESFAVVALVVGAAEAAVNVGAGAVAAAYLRPDRWLLRRADTPTGRTDAES
jgi:hypothetical protein